MKRCQQGGAQGCPPTPPPLGELRPRPPWPRTLQVRREVQQGAEGPFPDAVHAVAQLARLVEHVVAQAPKQHKERGPGLRAGGGAGKRRPGPKPLSAQQQAALRAGGGTHVAARPPSLLRRWAAALRGARGGAAAGTEQPSPAVTAAMAMAQSLLYMGADSGILGECPPAWPVLRSAMQRCAGLGWAGLWSPGPTPAVSLPACTVACGGERMALLLMRGSQARAAPCKLARPVARPSVQCAAPSLPCHLPHPSPPVLP